MVTYTLFYIMSGRQKFYSMKWTLLQFFSSSQKKRCSQCREWSPGYNEGCCLCPASRCARLRGDDCWLQPGGPKQPLQEWVRSLSACDWRKIISYYMNIFQNMFLRCSVVYLFGKITKVHPYIYGKWMLLMCQCTSSSFFLSRLLLNIHLTTPTPATPYGLPYWNDKERRPLLKLKIR